MPAQVERATVSGQPLDLAAIESTVDDERAGATVTFTGVVRNHDGGRGVTEIEYVGHPSAQEVLRGVAEQVAAEADVHRISVAHRVGTLAVGDLALVAAVSASHRAEAFATAAALVDLVKERLPVWKRQRFTDGTTEWTGCP